MTEKEKKILDMQCPSTKRALMRDPSEDRAWHNRPIPENYLAVADAKNLDELVAPRPLTYQEAAIESGLRHNRGAILAQMRKEPDACAHTPHKKSAAVNAFMFMRRKFSDLMQWSGLATEKEAAMVRKHEK